MRRADGSIKLIASGSSNFGPGADWMGWNRTVLERLKNEIDYISLHTYIGNRTNNFEKFLGASPGPRRSHRGGEGADPGGAGRQPDARPIYIAFDEWNVWYRRSPRHHGVRDRQDRPGGALQLRGRAGHGHVPQRLLPPRRHGEDGEPGAARERDRADLHQPAGPVPADRSTSRSRSTPSSAATSRSTCRWTRPTYKPDERAPLGYLDVSATYDPGDRGRSS